MAADEAGFGECVAASGTALTADHARQLGNLVGNQGRLIILLDGDRAGQANSIKAVRTCLAVGVPVRVAVLLDELDPAELPWAATRPRAGAGRACLAQVLAAGRSDIDHLLRALAPRPYELDEAVAQAGGHRPGARGAAADRRRRAARPACARRRRLLRHRTRLRLERRLAGVEARAAAVPAPGRRPRRRWRRCWRSSASAQELCSACAGALPRSAHARRR